MKNLPSKAIWSILAPLCLLWMSALPLQAADYTNDQNLSFQVITDELFSQNGVEQTADFIESATYWVDVSNGVDASDQTGRIDKPWKSITWAMYNIPHSENEANIVVRGGTYSPPVLYFGKERGGSSKSPSPFNLLAYPGEEVILDGSNVAKNSALISISGAAKVTISGLQFTNVQGAGKSVIYISNSDHITLSNNEINNAKWTDDADDSESPTLADRLNAIAVLGESNNIMIKNNFLSNLITGYGEPILVAEPAVATLSNNQISDVDASSFAGQRYYVSPEGDDTSGIGTKDKPWKTIHKALFTVPFDEDDARIIIRGGTYKIPTAMYFDAQRGGSEGKFFTVTSYKDEEVIIDGSLLKEPFSAMASFSSTAYVRIKGLTFANLKGLKSGISIEGTSHHIRIVNNTLRDMTWAYDQTKEKNPEPSDNLNPIAVIGNHPTQAINNIFIRGNTLTNIVPGYSEGIKIVGNVTNFVVARNHISNIANIGIVAAGNYAWVVDSVGVRIPNEVNHARYGVIRNNVVHKAVSPIANSAGIYLDGARYVTVKGNTSYNNSVGFSVGSEQPGDATGNILMRNIAYDNTDAGIVVGTIHDNAVVNNTIIVNNEFRNNYAKGGYGGEMTIQKVNGLKVDSNLFSSRSDLMIVASQPSTNLTLNKNLYYGVSNLASTAVFDWGGIAGTSYVGLQNYQAATCNDLSSLYQDATTVDYFEGIKNSSNNEGKRKGKNKELRQIKRACYKGTKIW